MASLALWKDRTDFSHFLGWATKSAPGLIHGSDGLIPSTGNFHPGLYSQLLQAVQNDQHDKAFQLQKLSDHLGDLYQAGRLLSESLWGLKVLMKQRGICDAHVMPPLQAGTAEEEREIAEAFKNSIEKEKIEFE